MTIDDKVFEQLYFALIDAKWEIINLANDRDAVPEVITKALKTMEGLYLCLNNTK